MLSAEFLKGTKPGLRFPRWRVDSNGTLLPELPKLFDSMSRQLAIAGLLDFTGGDFQTILSVSQSITTNQNSGTASIEWKRQAKKARPTFSIWDVAQSGAG